MTGLPARSAPTTDPVRVVVKHAREAYGTRETVAAEWRALGFVAPPDPDRAVEEYARFADRIARLGGQLLYLPRADGTGLDSIYVRDAAVYTPRGMVLGCMGKPLRAGEPAAQGAFFESVGVPILGRIEPPGTLEGGDVTWLGDRLVAVGRGYRTNDEGIRQFRALVADAVDEVLVVPLAHWRGPGEIGRAHV